MPGEAADSTSIFKDDIFKGRRLVLYGSGDLDLSRNDRVYREFASPLFDVSMVMVCSRCDTVQTL